MLEKQSQSTQDPPLTRDCTQAPGLPGGRLAPCLCAWLVTHVSRCPCGGHQLLRLLGEWDKQPGPRGPAAAPPSPWLLGDAPAVPRAILGHKGPLGAYLRPRLNSSIPHCPPLPLCPSRAMDNGAVRENAGVWAPSQSRESDIPSALESPKSCREECFIIA